MVLACFLRGEGLASRSVLNALFVAVIVCAFCFLLKYYKRDTGVFFQRGVGLVCVGVLDAPSAIAYLYPYL